MRKFLAVLACVSYVMLWLILMALGEHLLSFYALFTDIFNVLGIILLFVLMPRVWRYVAKKDKGQMS